MCLIHRPLNCLTNCHIPEVVPLQLEHLDLVEPVEGEAGDLDQPVLVQLEQVQALQVDEHLRRSPITTNVKEGLRNGTGSTGKLIMMMRVAISS